MLSELEGPRVLFTAFDEVPGASGAGVRTAQWLSVFGGREVDALSLKGPEVAHIQRFGGARMLRVPNALGRPFLSRIATYQRALQRQITGESYDVVWCADMFSAAIAGPVMKHGASLVMEVASLPSQRARSVLHDDEVARADLPGLERRWREQERLALRAARCVFLPSRSAARLLSERIDPRRLVVVPRAVDRSVWRPPSIEVAHGTDSLVVVFGGRESAPRAATTLGIVRALAVRLSRAVRIEIAGRAGPADGVIAAALARDGLEHRVKFAAVAGDHALATRLGQADVVVVPAAHEGEADPFAVPHRALEAMACGRPVVLTGHERSFIDAVVPGEHVHVAPSEPAAVADAVARLLSDSERRDALRRAAVRVVERAADLVPRSREAAQAVLDVTGLKLRVHAPGEVEPESSSQIVRRRVPSSPPVAAIPSPPVRASAPFPSLAARVAAEAPQPPEETLEPAAAGPAAPAAASRDGAPSMPSPVAVPAPRPAAASGLPPPVASTIKMDIAAFANLEPGAAWDGDTFLDGGGDLVRDLHPDPARVRAAMPPSSADAGRPSSRVPAPVELPSLAQVSSWSNSEDVLSAADDEEVEIVELLDAPAHPVAEDVEAAADGSQLPDARGSVAPQAVELGPAASSPRDAWAPDTVTDGVPVGVPADLPRQERPAAPVAPATPKIARPTPVLDSARAEVTRVVRIGREHTTREAPGSSEDGHA